MSSSRYILTAPTAAGRYHERHGWTVRDTRNGRIIASGNKQDMAEYARELNQDRTS